jgi:ankyrin repeat protein
MDEQQAFPEETIRSFVIAAHADLDTVRSMLTQQPGLLNQEYDWGPGGREDGLAAAAHMGNRAIAEYLLANGAPATICASAMLGDLAQVRRFLEDDPSLANARGAHQIPILFHAALSGQVALAELLDTLGCSEGHNNALHAAISFGHTDMVAWLLAHGVTDIAVGDFQDRKPRARALELGHTEIVALLDGWQKLKQA